MMFATTVIGLVFVIAFLGLIAWFVWAKGTMIPSFFKWLIYVVCAVVALFLVLQAFGILGEIRGVQVPRL